MQEARSRREPESPAQHHREDMDGWVGGCMSWVDAWTDGWMHDGWVDGCIHACMDARMDAQADRRPDGPVFALCHRTGTCGRR